MQQGDHYPKDPLRYTEYDAAVKQKMMRNKTCLI